ncbi:GNAT family N-acetyltransferase [Chitiniphilus eburneus]|uniref:GNAT family N-acetyltransferase n=1 Tax=Chitiniphilus eburneus TaxID=2571148 RepID=A0A4U0PAD6_9NEIS|nr:GNAT family N-acetyltransferase [Chitiniphilus eburneus]TJZ64617.1 GNAT family N-acetyltransferase [Chitiniphilus eburneus]
MHIEAPAAPMPEFAETAGFDFLRAEVHGDLADWLATPRLAQAWADAIADCWLAAEATGGIDATAPFTVLDLAPGEGRLRASLLPRLQVRLAALGRGHWQVDYRDDDQVVAPGANPVAWLAPGALGQPLPALFGVHYERTLRGELLATPTDTPQACTLHCDWQPVDAAVLDALPGDYLAHVNSAGFTVPLAALARLDALAEASAGRFLLLAVDYGVVEARDVRLGGLHPPTAFTVGNDRLPLNLHAIACHQQTQGAQVRATQQHTAGAVQYLAWRDAAHDGAAADAAALADLLAERLAGCGPDGHAASLDAAEHLPPRLALLQTSEHDPEICGRLLPALMESPPDDAVARAAWRNALRGVAAQPMLLEGSFQYGLACAAWRLGDLALARHQLAWLRSEWPDHPDVCHLLAEVEIAAGHAELAPPLLRQALATHPDHEAVQALLAQCETRAAARAALAWSPLELPRDGELTLEPLGPEHADALFPQYRDPQIGVMTRLPDFDTPAAMGEWLAEATTSNRHGYAVLHADAGAIGVVSAAWHGDAAYLHFWLGADWQGHGLAARTVRLALTAMPDNAQLYTSVYRDNQRSRRVLDRVGFTPLDCRAEAPDDGLVFMRWPERGDVAGLDRLLRGLESPIVLAGK